MLDTNEYRLVLTPSFSAQKNMAIDKAFVKAYKKDEKPILRLYTWQDSFTIGASQKIENYMDYSNQYENNYSKRITGGGVLFHGHDLSYSLVLPSSNFRGVSVKQSYERICQFLIRFYKSLGLNAKFAKDSQHIKLSKSEFCQIGFEAYDILVNNIKIGGNAQKRTKNIIFQHGSIPIKKTKNNKEFGTSLEELGIIISFEEAKERLIQAFEESFTTSLKQSSLTESECDELDKILEGI